MQLIKNALIAPLAGNMDHFSGGVFDANGKFLQDSVVYRGEEPPLPVPERRLTGTCLYGGCFFAHFGHFIWESLARLHAIRQCKPYPLLFISPNEEFFTTFKLIMRTIGLDNDVIILKQPTLIENLVYAPPQSSLVPLHMSDLQLASLACRNFAPAAEKGKIWLSRTHLKYGRIHNEAEIENEIRAYGYEIFSPESIPLLEQIRRISTARIVAGFDGSQFFSAFFSQAIFGEFHIFNRRPRIPPTIPYMLDKKGIRNRIYDLKVELFQSDPDFNGKNYIVEAPDRIIETLIRL